METVTSLKEEISFLRNQLQQKDSHIQTLEEKLNTFLHRRFGTSSEKISVDQLGLFDEVDENDASSDLLDGEQQETVTVQSYQRKTKPRVSIPDDIPCEEIIYDLPEGQKICPHDGAELKVIGSEDHKQLEIIPAKIYALIHKRLKYACPCCDQHIVTASKPKQPIEKSIASPSLLAFVATQKYADALPLYRQSEMFKRIGIELDRSNLASWMVKTGELIQPLINLLHEHICQQPLIHMDETTVQVLEEPGKPAQSKSYMWCMGHFKDKPAVIFDYDPSQSQSVPERLLNHEVKAIMTDAYQGYQTACDTYKITRLGCWAHARRKFVDAQKLQKKGKTGKADQALAFIQKLYALEKRIKDEPLDQRYEARQKQAKPMTEKLKAWLDKSLLTVPPQSALGKALAYLQKQWPRLIGYLNDGHYPIDNNAAERAIRPFTIGRKNWMFSKSQKGAKANANLYSLIETAKANELNPYEYLMQIFKELPNAQSIGDIESLLPWNTELV